MSYDPYFKVTFISIRCKEWVRLAGDEDLVLLPLDKPSSIRYVCGLHFHEDDTTPNRKRLLERAVPSIFLEGHQFLAEDVVADFPLQMELPQRDHLNVDTVDIIDASSELSGKNKVTRIYLILYGGSVENINGHIEADIREIELWCLQNKMKLNENKCSVI